MSDLHRAASEYLAIRRTLGFKLEKHTRLLASFVAFLENAEAPFITSDLALAWASDCEGSSAWRRQRLSTVRGFAKHMASVDPRTQVPPPNLIAASRQSRRPVPYLYSNSEITRLMQAATQQLGPLQAATYETLIGLLAVTGLRVGEAISLDRDDIDDARRVLIVRDAKHGKSREVPLHPTTLTALHAYLRRRDDLRPLASGPSLFISTTGTRLSYKVVHPTFGRLCKQAAIPPRPDGRRARMHDVRHSFAVATLLDWYRDDADIDAVIPRLSTILGHLGPASTYWYLQASPELMALAAGCLQRALEDPR
jgi:integrase/recombinase XerD